MHPLCRHVLILTLLVCVFVGLELVEVYHDVLDEIDHLQSAKLEEQYLLCADRLDAEGLQKALDAGVNPNTKASKDGGALFRILNRQHESDEMLEALSVVLAHPATNPNGSGDHWPSLKLAVSHGHRHAVQLLLNHPKIQSEFSFRGLTCDQVAALPEGVHLAHDPNAPECVKRHPRFRAAPPQQQRQQQASASRVREVVDLDDSNPFQPTQEGRYPRHDQYVMSPAAFDNIVEATRYYLFGRPWTGLELSIIVVLISAQVVLSSTVFVLTQPVAAAGV